MLTVTSEDVCCSIPNVEFDIIKVSYTMRLLFLMFVTPVCVIPFKTGMAKNQEYLRYHEITILKEKSSLNLFMPVAKFRTVSLKEKKNRVAQSLSFVFVFL